jgi:hypothetical protein
MRVIRKPRLIVAATAAAVAALALAGVASAAGGAHTQSFTDNFHGTQTSTDTNPCTGNAVDLTQTTSQVDHVTFFPGSDEVWTTFTEEDRFTALDEGTGVLYTGHSTTWGNFNMNEQNSNSTFTATVRATGSDGSTTAYHEVSHFTMLPSGDVSVTFDKVSLTCG